MNCADFEILLCDYVDGTLHGAQKSAFETHLAECPVCAELARDSAGAVAFIERAAVVDPPAELVTRILFEIPTARRQPETLGRRSFWSRVRSVVIDPVLQPRFAMGMAMTVLSFAMLGRFAGIEVRQLKPSDLNPVAVWTALEDRTLRAWERTVKYYDSLRLVYEIQTRLKDWSEQADAERPGGTGQGAEQTPRQTGESKEPTK